MSNLREYVAKGTITEGDLPDGVTLSYKIGEEDASLGTKYAVGTEVAVTLTDTTDTVEDVLVNNISIKSGDEYKFTIKEGTNKVTVKIKGETVVTKELPIIEKGNQSTKIEGSGIWIYLDNSELELPPLTLLNLLLVLKFQVKLVVEMILVYL